MVLVALIPNIIPQIITAAIMGYFGIPIKASTILVFSIASVFLSMERSIILLNTVKNYKEQTGAYDLPPYWPYKKQDKV